jgi:hypothetical protein
VEGNTVRVGISARGRSVPLSATRSLAWTISGRDTHRFP